MVRKINGHDLAYTAADRLLMGKYNKRGVK